MPRLVESEETLRIIKQKALRNSKSQNTYGKRASFNVGPIVISFEERCQIDRHLQTQTKH